MIKIFGHSLFALGLCLFTLVRLFKTRASTNMNNLGAALHFWYGTSSNMNCLIWRFKWFLKGVWEGYSSGYARSSSGRANKQPRFRFHVRNRPCTCRQQYKASTQNNKSNAWCFIVSTKNVIFSDLTHWLMTHWLIWLIKHAFSYLSIMWQVF